MSRRKFAVDCVDAYLRLKRRIMSYAQQQVVACFVLWLCGSMRAPRSGSGLLAAHGYPQSRNVAVCF